MNYANLTKREIQVLKLICDENTTKQAAHHLSIKPETVAYHRKNIMFKTGANNVIGLFKWALKNELYNL